MNGRLNGRFDRAGIAAAVALAIAVAAPAAFAQNGTPQQTPPPANGAAPAANAGPAPSQAELQNFANAAVQVQGIRKSMQPQLADAQSADAQNQVKAATEKKMEAAVRENHLTLHRYVELANLVQTDSQVRSEVQKLMPPEPAPTSG